MFYFFGILVIMLFTDHLIEELISCPKKITSLPKQVKSNRGSTKLQFEMQSLDNEHDFEGFIVKNDVFQENFSIGLFYNLKAEKGGIRLLRCNGAHGGNKSVTHHFVNHIHTVKAEDLNNGVFAERHVIITEKYATYEDALQFFVKRINLKADDRIKHFPPPSGQIQLNFADGGED